MLAQLGPPMRGYWYNKQSDSLIFLNHSQFSFLKQLKNPTEVVKKNSRLF